MSNLIASRIPPGCYLTEDHDTLSLPRLLREQPRTIKLEDVLKIGYTIPTEVSDDLERVSQLGLKELWLGGKPSKHNRWHHSIGSFIVGIIWLHVLEGRVPKEFLRWPLDSWRKVHGVVGTTLLLHDYGHLPFAHMMDEVLQHINWIPRADVHGLEAAVLDDRLSFPHMSATWQWLTSNVLSVHDPGAPASPITNAQAQSAVRELILGSHGTPWLQAIVNSPIDADKIDYLRYDSACLRECSYPVHHRLLLERADQWLADFLSEQDVNHAGILCLHGRSAAAAADLWRERVFMYDRVYLSPELRVPERMAMEIVQQFLIRSTMSTPFLRRCGIPDVEGFADRLSHNGGSFPNDLLRLKYETVKATMFAFLPNVVGPTLEFAILKRMIETLGEWKGMDTGYRYFLKSCFALLESLQVGDAQLRNQDALRHMLSLSLVKEPLVFARDAYRSAREMLRPLQHCYAREVAIDLVQLPRVLAGPRTQPAQEKRSVYNGATILVPEGPITTWGAGKRATAPLRDHAVDGLERPFCRLLVISPGLAESPRAIYIWERIRAVLIEGGIQLIERREDE